MSARAHRLRYQIALGACIALGAACSKDKPEKTATDAGRPDASQPADADVSPPQCKRNNPLREAFFGDLHVHTALSLDANLQGTRLRPMDAYRFARGEGVGLPPYSEDGKPSRMLKLSRPLDFVALSDHAEFLGLVTTCLTPELEGYDSEECVQYRNEPDRAFTTLNARLAAAQGSAQHGVPCTKQNAYCGSAAMGAWNEVIDAAQTANDATEACEFSAFVAYEWSATPGLSNLHRNVIFRGSKVPSLPFSYFDGSEEEDLWNALERDCTNVEGCDVLTIPHNSNLSTGLMFEPVNRAGKPIDADYAKRRASFEPLAEIFQHKGSSECLPEQGPDELCSFELMPYNNLGTVTLGGITDTLVPSDYLRHALGEGLRLQKRLGANPFAYGFVGSTDTHLGIPGAVEDASFQGHGGAGSNARTTVPSGLVDNVWLNPGGLAVLWAEENSRDSLFEAMRRREAYATSGPRILLRFFGGFELEKGLCESPDFAAQGYATGVPMGGELAAPAKGKAPSFAVWALRDPGTKTESSGLLQRVQIIKGYLSSDQTVAYRIYDIAGDANNGASVDAATCEPKGKGADELCSVWSDPDFDASQSAFYYARVIENPSCRWHERACVAAAVDCDVPDTITPGYEDCCGDYPRLQQERAWSSPIYYRAP